MTNKNLNDAKGKLNEILLAYHLHPHRVFPEHFREIEMSPQVVHDDLAETLGPEVYKAITAHTFEMSTRVKAHMVLYGHMANTVDVQSVTWTSNRDTEGSIGDHERVVGVKDLNSDADIIVRTISGNFFGISAKYGTSKSITLRNPGCKMLERVLGITGLGIPWEEHRERVRELGYVGTGAEMHAEYKADRESSDFTKKCRADAAKASGISARHGIARKIHSAMSKMTSDDLKYVVIELAAPRTYIDHYRTQTRPTKSGVEHHINHIRDHTVSCVVQYDQFEVNPTHTASMAVPIYGVRGDVREVVAQISIKGRSGPMLNWNGTFTAPMLSKRF